MIATDNKTITVTTTVNLPVEKVWKFWTEPHHILHWNYAIPEWHTPYAENEVKEGSAFLWRMEARDNSMGFDFVGTYTKVVQNSLLEILLGDNRRVSVQFVAKGNQMYIEEQFEPEALNPLELQQNGWQAILNNFKTYAEKYSSLELIHFEVLINAPVDKVFKTIFDDKKWREWTYVFNPTSYYNGKWEKGAKMLFLGTDQDGNMGGMVSRIKEWRPNKFVSIEHLGILKGDEEITIGNEVEQWAGAQENYSFTETAGKTLFEVTMDSNEEFKSYFIDTWPKALVKIKEICER